MKKISDLFKEAIEASGLNTDYRFKQYVKWIDVVDFEKSNGYAFVGDFVNHGTVEYQIGKPRLLLVQSTTGSMKYNHQNFQVIRMNPDGSLEKTAIHDTDEERGWALRIRGEVDTLLNELSQAEAPSPFAEFLDGDLISELTRRGYQVTK